MLVTMTFPQLFELFCSLIVVLGQMKGSFTSLKPELPRVLFHGRLCMPVKINQLLFHHARRNIQGQGTHLEPRTHIRKLPRLFLRTSMGVLVAIVSGPAPFRPAIPDA